MLSIIGPFFHRCVNWVKKEILLISSWQAINSSIKMDQEIIVSFFSSQSHWYHTNCSGSKYDDAIVPFVSLEHGVDQRTAPFGISM